MSFDSRSSDATIANMIGNAQARIAASGSTSPRLDAEVLFRHATGMDRTQLFLAMQDKASDDVAARFQDLVAQRIAGTPVAYLTGHREFMGLEFLVTPDVLIPRPETELLVEWALGNLDRNTSHTCRVADVGSGSGAIAVSIAALSRVDVHVVAIEPSAPARDVIARNADALLNHDQRARFAIAAGDLLTGQPGPFDMVLANLPYLTPEQIAGNPDLDAEPRLALDGGNDGLDLVNRLIPQLPDRLSDQCAVGLEIDPSQSGEVVDLLQHTLPGADVSIIKDLAGHDRHIVATAPGKPSSTP